MLRKRWGQAGGIAAATMLSLAAAGCAAPPSPPELTAPAATEGENYAAYVAGRFAVENGDPRAADLLLEAARQDPGNLEILHRAFLALITAGRMAEAVTVAETLARRDAHNGIVELVLAVDAIARQDFDAALAHQERIGSGGFESLIGPILKAWVLAAKGDRKAALRALERLRTVAPLRPFALAHAAYMLDFLGDEEAATAAYKEALESGQLSSLQPVVSYAAFLQKHRRATEALAVIEQYALMFRDSGYLETARNRLIAGEPVEVATTTPQSALALVLFRAASELEREEVRQPAIIYARLATHLTPQSDEARLRLAGMLADAEMYDAALGVLDAIGRQSPEYGAARMQVAWIYERSGDSEAAIGALTNYLASEPDNIRAWATLGDVYRGQEKFRDAARAYSRAIALLDKNSEVEPWFLYFARGIAYERQGQWEIAEADLLKALELNPEEPQVLNYLGYSWIDRGVELDRGTELIKKAAALRPNDGYIIDSLGWAYFLRGDYDEAVRTLERAVQLEPTDPTINDHLGDAYWRVGREMEARFQWRHALAFGPEKESDRKRIADKLDFGLDYADAGATH
ncbi:MAG: tetratricopeptide repeat protein [Rhodothalassiaceae bacterium]